MLRWTTWSIAIGVAASAVFGCGGSEDPAAIGPPAKLAITTPADGDHVVAERVVDGDEVEAIVDVTFVVEGFTLKAPGTCDGAPRCGHVAVLVDGDRCNDTTDLGDPLPYNAEGFESPIEAELQYCPGGAASIGGAHLLALELRGDDEHVDAVASVGVTAELAPGGGNAP